MNKIWFREPALVRYDEHGSYEFSANPDDYFMMGDEKFEDATLSCTAVFGCWSRKVVLKDNPTRKDMSEWKELANLCVKDIIEDMIKSAKLALESGNK